MQDIGFYLLTTLKAIPYFVVLCGAIVLGKLAYVRTSQFSVDDELTKEDNPALGITVALYMLGLGIAVSGTVARGIGYDDPLVLVPVILFSLVSIGMMRLSVFVNDKLILNRFHTVKELVEDRNCGTAFVVGGGCVATGFIIHASWTVTTLGETFLVRVGTGLLLSLLYFVLGQLLLVLGGKVYELITPYDVHKSIEEDDNTAVGLSFCGFLVGLGIIGWRAIFRSTEDVLADVLIALWIMILGLILMVATRILADNIILPQRPLVKEVAEQQNVAAGAIVCICFIAIAIVYVIVLPVPGPPGVTNP
ncbi:MAG: DUF350 domain-containing protein [Gemmataceae bacterium]